MHSAPNVAQQIRFAIQCLSERNGFHEFEEACRHFARARITLNILPATGPVGVGGDQGRDFETFRTFIHSLGDHTFSGIGNRERLAFACSLISGEKLSAKVRADVTAIMAGSLRTALIYFFAGSSLPVAKRHELQTWAKDQHQVELEIIDALGLAEQLSSPELFWIAARFFNVSLEVFPPSVGDDTYQRTKEKWLSRSMAAATFADFVEVKRAARRSLDEFQQDLPNWINHLVGIEHALLQSAMWPSVTYEVIALTMRLTRSLHGQEERIRRFMSRDFANLLPDQIEQLVTIATYAITATRLGAASLATTELTVWRDAIRGRISAGIAAPISVNQKCLWLKEEGRMRFLDSVADTIIPDLGTVYKPWLDLSLAVGDAQTFPIRDFHDDVIEIIQIVGEHPVFDQILANIRPAIRERVGDAAVADSHFERAKQLLESDHSLRAIQELHSAKIQWLGAETLGQSVFCCMLLARCYADLGLHYAGLYHALIANHVAVNSNQEWLLQRASEALFVAFDCIYRQGHVCLAWELSGVALLMHHKLSANPLELSEHPDHARFIQNVPLVLITAEKLAPAHRDKMVSDLDRWGLRKIAESFLEETRSMFSQWDQARFEGMLGETFTGPPFSDAGDKCVCMWAAHGLRFSARWDNNYDVNCYAGEFIALFQIALADLGGMDLDIVPGDVLLEVKLHDGSDIKASRLPSNEAYRWEIVLPRDEREGLEGINEKVASMMGAFYEILRGISVMPENDFASHLETDWIPKTYQHGFFARRYAELFKLCLPIERFGAIGREAAQQAPPSDDWQPTESRQLSWHGGLHPSFNEEEEIARVQKRYDVCAAGLRYSLPRLLSDSQFKTMIARFKRDGWKDWHILSGLLNVVAGIRVTRRRGEASGREWMEEFQAEIFTPDTPNAGEVRPEDIKSEALHFTMLANIASTMHGNGLTLSSPTPSVVGEKRYMSERWRYFDLDVPHPPLLDVRSD